MTSSKNELVIRAASVEDILELRYRVLIVGTLRTTANLEGDSDPRTRHYGAFEPAPSARCVACVSFMPSDEHGEAAYQLRGMAVVPDLQGRGIGSALLDFAETEVWAEPGVRLLWCNARVRAVAFYERHGWQVVSDVFEIAGVGPHRRLTKRVKG